MPARESPPSSFNVRPKNTILKNKKRFEKEEKWWNEWPLEGSPDRPAVWITKVLSKSPLLIGWDDERMERRAMAALAKSCGKEVSELTPEDWQMPGKPYQEEFESFSFGLMHMITDGITKRILNLEVETPVDDEDGSGEDVYEKKTLKEVGGQIFVGEAEEPSAIKDTELYKLTLHSLQWQRDNYLVGKEYADQRRHQRRGGGGGKKTDDTTVPAMNEGVLVEQRALDSGLSPYQIPFDATAFGNIQLASLTSWFIPSQAVHYSLLPIVVELPGGYLYQPILQATANLIPLSQSNLDYVVKDQLLWFFKNSEWRSFIKSNTKGYITNTYVDRSQKR